MCAIDQDWHATPRSWASTHTQTAHTRTSEAYKWGRRRGLSRRNCRNLVGAEPMGMVRWVYLSNSNTTRSIIGNFRVDMPAFKGQR